MTGEEKDLLMTYLYAAGEIGWDDSGKSEDEEFEAWYSVRGEMVSGEVHYKAILLAARLYAEAAKRPPAPTYSETLDQVRMLGERLDVLNKACWVAGEFGEFTRMMCHPEDYK